MGPKDVDDAGRHIEEDKIECRVHRDIRLHIGKLGHAGSTSEKCMPVDKPGIKLARRAYHASIPRDH